MRTLPFFYYVFESKYGELNLNLSNNSLFEYKPPVHWNAWDSD
jgi:hypothetical protein